MRVAAILAVLLMPLAAAEPNMREDHVLEAPVLAVALSGAGDHLAIGIEDALTTHPMGPQQRDLLTWFLYGIEASYVVHQDGEADPPACDELLGVTEDCDSDVTFVAISGNGARMVAASQTGPSMTQLVFIDRAKGELLQRSVPGVLHALDMDGAGAHVAAAFDTSGVTSGGAVWLWTWGGEFTGWSKKTDAPATSLDLSHDGERLVVGAGSKVHVLPRQESATGLTDDWSPRTVTAVSISERSDHLAAAANDRGGFRLYADGAASPERLLNVPGSQTAATALSLRPDGSQLAIALGDELRVQGLDGASILGPLLGQGDHGSPITRLAYDREGDDLLVAGARDLALWATDPVQRVWKTTLTDDIKAVSMDGTGDRIAVAFASTLRLYEAQRAASLNLQAPAAIDPGTTDTMQLKVTNTGDRKLVGTVQLSAPQGVGATLASDEVMLLPGKSVTLPVTMEVPGTHPAGPMAVQASFLDATTETSVDVPAREAWSLSAEGAKSMGVDEGAAAEFTLTLRNAGNVEAAAPLESRASPSGWAVTVEEAGVLTPGATRQLRVTLTAPDGAPNLAQGTAIVGLAGEMPIHLVATVGAKFQPTIDLAGQMAVLPGQVAEVPVRVHNGGNAPDSFTVRILEVPLGWTATFKDGHSGVLRDVPPGGHGELTLVVRAPAELVGSEALRIEAESLGDPSKVAGKQVGFSLDTEGSKKSPLPVVVLLAGLALAARRRA